VASTPEELDARLKRDIAAVGGLAKAIGLVPE
jgi:tripartite-type tricarboxylate transporter receptor subunit TctC